MAAKSAARRLYIDALAKWPKQDLRPDFQFQDIYKKQVDQNLASYSSAVEAKELQKARALQYLVQDRWMKRYPLDSLLRPTGQPTYFNDLVKEIEEAPNRTWLQRLGKRLGGMVRLE